ncbi:hypothetical protein OG235_36815 [Streptomyces sp. NBC_00024]|uniref:hypothetical protein n=1 Tax=Streptomyces sp. NBC_00024 TaxID=2903612 RepID=UPI00325173E8
MPAITTAKWLATPLAQAIADEAAAPHSTPLAQAKLFRLLVDGGYSELEIGEMFGQGPEAVCHRLGLLALIPDGQGLADRRVLPVDLGYYIGCLSPENQQLMISRWRTGGFSSSGHAERYACALIRDENSATRGAATT